MDTLVDEVTRRVQTSELPQCYLEAFNLKKGDPAIESTDQPTIGHFDVRPDMQ